MVPDIATSVASNGAIRSYALEGKPMPQGWVISREDGQPITDGKRLDEGMFVPIGGYKGSGLSLVLGLLAGPLNRAAFGFLGTDDGKDRRIGRENQFRTRDPWPVGGQSSNQRRRQRHDTRVKPAVARVPKESEAIFPDHCGVVLARPRD